MNLNVNQIFPHVVTELNDRIANPTRYVNNPIWKNNGYGSRAEKIFKSICEGQYNLMANKGIKSKKIVMPRELYYEAISSFEFLRWGAVHFENGSIPKIFGMDVEIGNTFAVKSEVQFNETIDLTDVWKRLNFKQLNGLIIVVKSRIRSEYLVQTPAESKALDTLRDMISEADFRRYLIYRFLLVTGKSGKIYQIFNLDRHIHVWEKGQHIEDLCVYLKDNRIPPTDKLIAFKIMIETDEEAFRKSANIYNYRKETP
jgi:hypothetical protein